MKAWARGVGCVLAGLVGGGLVVAVLVLLVGRIFPLPAGTDPEALGRAVAAMPPAAFAAILGAELAGALAGSALAARLGGRQGFALGAGAGGVFLLAGLSNLASLPHPLWAWAAGLVGFPAAGWLGARLGARPASRPPDLTPTSTTDPAGMDGPA